jgi:gamma-glutamyltranspeptidase/glutathione hydrolase
MTVFNAGDFAGELHACYGVMGDYMQPQGHFQVLVNAVDLGMMPQSALDTPRWRLSYSRSDSGGNGVVPLLVEEGWSFSTLAELARRGHTIVPVDGLQRTIFGGGQVIMRNPKTGVLVGGSDPRLDGLAIGW